MSEHSLAISATTFCLPGCKHGYFISEFVHFMMDVYSHSLAFGFACGANKENLGKTCFWLFSVDLIYIKQLYMQNWSLLPFHSISSHLNF